MANFSFAMVKKSRVMTCGHSDCVTSLLNRMPPCLDEFQHSSSCVTMLRDGLFRPAEVRLSESSKIHREDLAGEYRRGIFYLLTCKMGQSEPDVDAARAFKVQRGALD